MNSPESAPSTPHNRLSLGRTATASTDVTTTAPTTASPALSSSKCNSSTPASASVSFNTSPSASPSASCHGPITKQCSSGSPRIVFGHGAVARLPSELNHLRLISPLIVSSPSRISLARRVQALIPNLDSRILDSALVNVPQRVVDDAVGRISGRDCVISVGGSSAVKLAKAIGMRKKIPHICIPTTYSGSEMPLLGDSRRRGGSKPRRQRSDSSAAEKSASGASSTNSDSDSHAMPTIVIYDEELTNTNTSMIISAPNEAQSRVESCRRSANADDAQWSYIHLPGV